MPRLLNFKGNIRAHILQRNEFLLYKYMAPPGINTFFDNFEAKSISLFKTSPLMSALSSKSFPTPSTWDISVLSAISSDHDYVIKSDTSPWCGTTFDEDYSCVDGGDALLSSCVPGKDNTSSSEPDFLQDLEDLRFTLDDFDPNSEVTMEDSFQDFIDSALERTCSPFLVQDSGDSHTSETVVQNLVILNQEQFLAQLHLQPSLSSSQPSTSRSGSSERRTESGDGVVSDMMLAGTWLGDRVPTRECSCLQMQDSVPAVYSLAQTSSSCTLKASQASFQNKNTHTTSDCSHEDSYYSTSLRDPALCEDSNCQESPIHNTQHSTDLESMDVSLEDNEEVTEDIMTWLSGNQRDETACHSESAPPLRCTCSHSLDKHLVSSAPLSPLDWPLFIEVTNCSTEHIRHLPSVEWHCSCADEPKTTSDTIHQKTRSLSSSSESALSSPEQPGFDSPRLPLSSSLKSVDFSSPSDYEDLDEVSYKSPLALLDLFSDENATILLHSDATVPYLRFT